MAKIKKTERIFTPVTSVKHLLSLTEPREEKTLFRYREGAGYGAMSYGTFYHRTVAVAAGLNAMGLADKRIAVIGETSPEWVSTYLGTIAAGGVIIPMDKELNITEIEGFLSGVEAEAVVMGKGFAEKFAHAMEAHPTLRFFFSTEEVEETDKLLRFETLVQKGEEALAAGYTLPDRDRENLAVILYAERTFDTRSGKVAQFAYRAANQTYREVHKRAFPLPAAYIVRKERRIAATCDESRIFVGKHLEKKPEQH